MIKRKKILKRILRWQLLALLMVVFLFSVNLYATITVNDPRAEKAYIPPGNNTVPVMYFSIESDASDALSSVAISDVYDAVTVNVGFGNGVGKVSIYEDSTTAGTEGTFDSNDVLRSSESFSSSSGTSATTSTLSFNKTLSSTATGYFITYDVDSDVILARTAKVDLTAVNGSAVAKDAQTITISGISVLSTTDLSSTLIVPGLSDYEKVNMLKVQLMAKGEDMDNLALTINDPNGNFVTNSSSEAGVVGVRIYQYDGVLDFDSDTLGTLKERVSADTAPNFASAYNASFTFEQALDLVQDTTVNLYIVYDIGEDIPLTQTDTVKGQITAISAAGGTSGLAASVTSSQPSSPVEFTVGGFTYSDIGSLVPDNDFGPGNEVPMLKFKLKGENMAVTVNEITIQNTGTVPFITNSSQTNGVTSLKLYEDTNDDGVYYSTEDTLLETVSMGYSGQTESLAPISLTSGYLLATSSTTTDNSQMFFVLYDLGENVQGANDASSNVVTTYINSELYAAESTANVSGTDKSVDLRGTLPASANVQASVADTSLSLLEVADISPTESVQGQIKIPMLYLKIKSEADVGNVVFNIANNQASFMDNGTGVSKIWIFEDVNSSRALDVNDKLYTSTTSFTSRSASNIPEFTVGQGDKEFLVYYDLGQVATVAASANVACQLNDITSGSESVLVFGGVLPTPKVPSSIKVNTKYLNLESVETSVTSLSNISDAFEVSVKVENTSTGSVVLTDLAPKFYFGSIGGRDISYEYTVTAADTYPATIAAGANQTFTYTVDPVNVVSEGSIYLDAYAAYTVFTSNSAVLTRYQGSDAWQLAADSSVQMTVQSNLEDYTWKVPAYIESIKVKVGSTWKTVQSKDAIAANSTVRVYFADDGNSLDEGSLKTYFVSETELSSLSVSSVTDLPTANTVTYTFNRDDGYLEISNIGSDAGSLYVYVKDLEENELPLANIQLQISSVIAVSDFLMYPSPYNPNNNDFKMGFAITQPAKYVDIYIFNSLGVRVWHKQYTATFTSIGYQLISNENITFSSGTYFAVIIVEDYTENTSRTTTKFAVY
ncbi:hypothetical protein HN511_03095 [bacterium]|nr:hypothetical protein [bacterium]